jgi:hypothetical protein
MKYFVQFLHIRENELHENLGSDGVFILDGRNNLNTMKCDAQERMFKLRNVSKIDGYRIMEGERFTNAQMKYQWVRSGARPNF